LAADADRMTDHFVGQARGSGQSWTSIGDLGLEHHAAKPGS
jgi:hypothetical protein